MRNKLVFHYIFLLIQGTVNILSLHSKQSQIVQFKYPLEINSTGLAWELIQNANSPGSTSNHLNQQVTESTLKFEKYCTKQKEGQGGREVRESKEGRREEEGKKESTVQRRLVS